MNRTIKWVLIIGGGLIVVFVAALVLIPRFIDVKRYKPQIEAEVSKATGYPKPRDVPSPWVMSFVFLCSPGSAYRFPTFIWGVYPGLKRKTLWL